ncbi:MAG TPA: UpxY family transcription antiterminator [Chitinophagales bacterium]|nr:UpxY family transcription antiterminator [Chitinophagales bacterium]HRG84699.1 UpxY family transcription antiterminator [Chitinophagales bacterium]
MAANPDTQNPASPLLWHVAYVKSRSEKKVKERLDRMGIQAFLPLIKTVRQWSDRKKTVQVPLFNGYIFLQLSGDDYTRVRMVEGVVNFIYQEKKIAVVPEKQIEDIRTFLESGLPVSASTDTFSKGEQVVINFGPLKGYQGELLEIENENHFIVRIEVINQILRLSVPKAYLEKV